MSRWANKRFCLSDATSDHRFLPYFLHGTILFDMGHIIDASSSPFIEPEIIKFSGSHEAYLSKYPISESLINRGKTLGQ